MIITDRIDYEALDTKQLTFDIAVYDAGVPQKSAMASVVVNVQNLNDESPVFEQPEGYSASGKQSMLEIKQSMPEIEQIKTKNPTDLIRLIYNFYLLKI